MNKNTRNQTKKLIIVLIIITLCNFVMPNYTFASEINGGIFFKPIAQFIARVADLVIQAFQMHFVGDSSIYSAHGSVENEGEKIFRIKYSPGIIFSGKIPGLDINFINPIKYLNVKKFEKYKLASGYDYDLLVSSVVQKILEIKDLETNIVVSEDAQKKIDDVCEFFLNLNFANADNGEGSKTFKINGNTYVAEAWNNSDRMVICKDYAYVDNIIIEIRDVVYTDPDFYEKKLPLYVKELKVKMEEYFAESKNEGAEVASKLRKELLDKKDMVEKAARKAKEDDKKSPYANIVFPYTVKGEELYIYIDCFIQGDDLIKYKILLLNSKQEEIEVQSIAETLKPIIATWYNVFQEFALVGLLVILVYVAIRILLSTTSQDKAKYKKMLVDWLVAICIVFVLHYIISIILTVTSSISDLFAESVVGEFGEDILMSEIRNMIGDTPDSFLEVFAETAMYVMLVIFTVLFTIQYLKRTIYVAFLTLISPLVAFTYPLDKIKDGKAQAFSAWLKEFIYSALVQPVHLVLYCMLVNSAIDFAKELPIYAIVVMGFLLPAEKFVKEMFGLNKSSAVGSMATALGGATIMNAMSKIGIKGSKSSNDSAGEENGNNSNVRTSNTVDNQNNPFIGDEQTGEELEEKTNVKKALKGFAKGTGKLATKYVFNKKTGKKLLRGTARIAGAASLGTVGLAAGLATGDMEKAFAGAAGGLAAGSRVGGNLVDGGANLLSGASAGLQGMKDAFGQGMYGEEAYAKMQQNEAFRKSPEYGKLIKQYPGQESTVEAFLNSGITDARKMGTAMKNMKDRKYNLQEAIQYMKMADKCPSEILYDKDKFITYLTVRDIPEAEAEKIRSGIIDFK